MLDVHVDHRRVGSVFKPESEPDIFHLVYASM